MQKPPLPVLIVSILFILVGCMGFAYHFNEMYEPGNFNETLWILFLRIVAVVCGILLLYKIGWVRWVIIAWLVYHIVIGALNSTSEMLVHIAFLILVSILLFLPVSSGYFRRS